MSKYAETKDVKITLPLALYDEILDVIKEQKMWAYPQAFIIEAIKEKLERTEHDRTSRK